MELQVLEMKYSLHSRLTGGNDVLPFYAYSFEQLYPNEDYVSGYGYHKSFRTVVQNGLKEICHELIPDYYYDLRNWEDFSCAAPQYMLLDQLGWNGTKPLSFKISDQVGIYLALEHFITCSPRGMTAGVTVSVVNGISEEYLIMMIKNTDNRNEGKLCLTDFCIEIKDIPEMTVKENYFKPWLDMNNQNSSRGEILMENSWFRSKIKYYRGQSNAV